MKNALVSIAVIVVAGSIVSMMPAIGAIPAVA